MIEWFDDRYGNFEFVFKASVPEGSVGIYGAILKGGSKGKLFSAGMFIDSGLREIRADYFQNEGRVAISGNGSPKDYQQLIEHVKENLNTCRGLSDKDRKGLQELVEGLGSRFS